MTSQHAIGDGLSQRMQALWGVAPQRWRALQGGSIAQVYYLQFSAQATPAHGRSEVVVKLGEGDFVLEATMLAYLRQHSRLPVPQVLHSQQDMLVLEYLPGQASLSPAAERHAAELFADLHQRSAEAYGFAHDTLIGSLRQPNPRSQHWGDFFSTQRLRHFATLAYDRGHLPQTLRQRVEKVAAAIDVYLDEPPRPALIHGDVWQGNLLSDGQQLTAVLDPALYYADAEVELAYMRLFNTFGEAFFRRYYALRPPRPGEARRCLLYQLYPLLVHTYYFGSSYPTLIAAKLEQLGV